MKPNTNITINLLGWKFLYMNNCQQRLPCRRMAYTNKPQIQNGRDEPQKDKFARRDNKDHFFRTRNAWWYHIQLHMQCHLLRHEHQSFAHETPISIDVWIRIVNREIKSFPWSNELNPRTAANHDSNKTKSKTARERGISPKFPLNNTWSNQSVYWTLLSKNNIASESNIFLAPIVSQSYFELNIQMTDLRLFHQ